MTSFSPALYKLLTTCPSIRVDKWTLRVIQDGMFTKDEIEELRKEDAATIRYQRIPFIANFLPDDIRPKGIPKM